MKNGLADKHLIRKTKGFSEDLRVSTGNPRHVHAQGLADHDFHADLKRF